MGEKIPAQRSFTGVKSRETSREAYQAIASSLSRRRREVYLYIAEHGPCCAQAVADALKLNITSVHPRIVELEQAKAVRVDGVFPSPCTGYSASRYAITGDKPIPRPPSRMKRVKDKAECLMGYAERHYPNDRLLERRLKDIFMLASYKKTLYV